MAAGIYLLKVNNRNIRAMCEMCSKLTVKTPEGRQWSCSSVSIVNFEHVMDSWDGKCFSCSEKELIRLFNFTFLCTLLEQRRFWKDSITFGRNSTKTSIYWRFFGEFYATLQFFQMKSPKDAFFQDCGEVAIFF